MSTKSLEIRAFGVDFEISVEADHLDTLRDQWKWCLPKSTQQRSISAIAPQGPKLTQQPITLTHQHTDGAGDTNAADYRLTTQLTGAGIHARAGDFFMLHAGGVVDQTTGRVAALVAESGTGKTTATRFLCSQDGLAYATDETYIANADGAYMPYPKPLSVLTTGDKTGEKSQHCAEDVGLNSPRKGALTVGPIILLDRVRTDDEPFDEPTLERVPIIDGLLTLLPQSSAIVDIPDCLHVISTLAARGGGIFKLRYREINTTRHLIDRAFAASGVEQDWVHVPGTWSQQTDDARAQRYTVHPDRKAPELTASTQLVRAPFIDAVCANDEDEVLLMAAATPVHLRAIGAMAWLMASRPVTVGDVLARSIELFGEHPDADQIVRDNLAEMYAHRVLDLANAEASAGA